MKDELPCKWTIVFTSIKMQISTQNSSFKSNKKNIDNTTVGNNYGL